MQAMIFNSSGAIINQNSSSVQNSNCFVGRNSSIFNIPIYCNNVTAPNNGSNTFPNNGSNTFPNNGSTCLIMSPPPTISSFGFFNNFTSAKVSSCFLSSTSSSCATCCTVFASAPIASAPAVSYTCCAFISASSTPFLTPWGTLSAIIRSSCQDSNGNAIFNLGFSNQSYAYVVNTTSGGKIVFVDSNSQAYSAQPSGSFLSGCSYNFQTSIFDLQVNCPQAVGISAGSSNTGSSNTGSSNAGFAISSCLSKTNLVVRGTGASNTFMFSTPFSVSSFLNLSDSSCFPLLGIIASANLNMIQFNVQWSLVNVRTKMAILSSNMTFGGANTITSVGAMLPAFNLPLSAYPVGNYAISLFASVKVTQSTTPPAAPPSIPLANSAPYTLSLAFSNSFANSISISGSFPFSISHQALAFPNTGSGWSFSADTALPRTYGAQDFIVLDASAASDPDDICYSLCFPALSCPSAALTAFSGTTFTTSSATNTTTLPECAACRMKLALYSTIQSFDFSVEVAADSAFYNSPMSFSFFSPNASVNFTQSQICASTVNVSAAGLAPGAYIFGIVVSRGARSISLYQSAIVVPSEPLKVQIVVQSPLSALSIDMIRDQVVVSASVSNTRIPVDFTWTLQGLATGTPFTLSPNALVNIRAGDVSSTIVFNAGAFQGLADFKFVLSVTAQPHSPSSFVQSSIQQELDINVPPSGGVCSVSPLNGSASSTLFTASCSGWAGPSTQPLNYAFSFFVPASASDLAAVQSGRLNFFDTVVGPRSTSAQASFNLPSGNAATSFIVFLFASVVDYTGASTRVLAGNVTVQISVIAQEAVAAPDLQSFSSQLAVISSNASSDFSASSAFGDVIASAQKWSAVLNSISNTSYAQASSSSVACTNLRSTVVSALLQSTNSTLSLTQSVAQFSFDAGANFASSSFSSIQAPTGASTTSDIIQQSVSSLQNALSVPSQISPDTQTAVLSALPNLVKLYLSQGALPAASFMTTIASTYDSILQANILQRQASQVNGSMSTTDQLAYLSNVQQLLAAASLQHQVRAVSTPLNGGAVTESTGSTLYITTKADPNNLPNGLGAAVKYADFSQLDPNLASNSSTRVFLHQTTQFSLNIFDGLESFTNKSAPNSTYAFLAVKSTRSSAVTVTLTSTSNVELPITGASSGILISIPGSSNTQVTVNSSQFLATTLSFSSAANPFITVLSSTPFYDASKTLAYTVYLLSIPPKCQFWDAKTNTWGSAGCSYVPTLSTAQSTVCNCTHLTSFSLEIGSIDDLVTLIPVTPAATTPALARILANITLVILISCLSGLYMVLLLVFHIMDRRDIRSHFHDLYKLQISSPKHGSTIALFIWNLGNAFQHEHSWMCLLFDQVSSGMLRSTRFTVLSITLFTNLAIIAATMKSAREGSLVVMVGRSMLTSFCTQSLSYPVTFVYRNARIPNVKYKEETQPLLGTWVRYVVVLLSLGLLSMDLYVIVIYTVDFNASRSFTLIQSFLISFVESLFVSSSIACFFLAARMSFGGSSRDKLADKELQPDSTLQNQTTVMTESQMKIVRDTVRASAVVE